MTGTTILSLDAVCKSYGPIPVLKNLSFDVRDGETIAIIGPNGAGKTTMFRTLTGEVRVNSGRILYRGQDVTTFPDHVRVGMGLGRTFQVSRVFLDMTAIENMVVAIESRPGAPRAAWYRIAAPRAVISEAADRLGDVGLAGKAEMPAKFLSHGDKKRLEFAMMLTRAASVLLMDEPTAGMSPADRGQTIRMLKDVRKHNRQTLLLTEHDMDVVFDLADRILVLNYGEKIALGTPEEIRGSDQVREVYLGQEADLAVD